MNGELNIRNEEKLLIDLCRLEFSDEHLKKIGTLLPEIKEWDYFRKLATEHGVAALVWYNLEKHNLNRVLPEETSLILRGSLLKSLSLNTFNTGSLAEVLRLLNRENIRTVLLKGMALENSVYDNKGLRQMADIDILIAGKDCIRARKILLMNGYESLPVKSVFHKLILVHTGKHLPSLLKNGTSVEIHHELFGGKNSRLTELFNETSTEIVIRGEKAWIAQPQVFFIYLIKHLHRHEMNNESQIRLYTDLVVLIEKYQDGILNTGLLELAAEAEMQEPLANHLLSLREFWGLTLRGGMNEFINNHYSKDFLNKFLYFVKSPKNNPPSDSPRFYRQVVSDIPGLHRKILFVLGDLFPTIRFMKDRYKCSSALKVVFYYPHRWGKLIWLLGH